MRERAYGDLRDHIRALDDAGLLVRVDVPINKDTELEIRTEGNALIIMPVRKGKDEDRERSFRDALKWVIEHHGETLQKLAK